MMALTAATVALLGFTAGSPVQADSTVSMHAGHWIPGHVSWWNGQNTWISGRYGYPRHGAEARYPNNQKGYSYNHGYASN